jgi:predicted metal-binding protein
LKGLVKAAKAHGATSVKIISARDVFVDKRARLKCLVPRCSSYGRHLLCPPSLMPVDEFKEILDCYESGLLIQVEADVDSSDKSLKHLDNEVCEEIGSETDSREWQLKLLRLVNTTEAIAFKMGFYFAAGLAGGNCCLCRECVTPQSGRPCKHPFQARPSMEAMGIDVIKTCRKARMPVSLSSKNAVRWTGLLLVD